VKAGERHTKASRERIRMSLLGVRRSDETRERMRQAQRARRERERRGPQAERLRLLYQARVLEERADALREQEAA
jgi:hypothetical protein